MPKKFTIEEVKKKSLEKGFEFIDNKYINSGYKHRFSCLVDGEIHKSRFNCIKHGGGLRCCYLRKCKKSGEERRPNLNSIKARSLKLGFEFLGNIYINRKQKYKFRCLEDNEIHEANFTNILNGHGLLCCKSRKISQGQMGENNTAWKSELTELDRSLRKRNNFEDVTWKKQVKKRDGFRCIVCRTKPHSKNLHAHHLESYRSHSEKRHDIRNGVSLCKKHHVLFHSIYGKNNSTKVQFDDFLNKFKIKEIN